MGTNGNITKSPGTNRKLTKKFGGANSFWSKLDGDELLLAVNM